jgi:hypothetical protein
MFRGIKQGWRPRIRLEAQVAKSNQYSRGVATEDNTPGPLPNVTTIIMIRSHLVG